MATEKEKKPQDQDKDQQREKRIREPFPPENTPRPPQVIDPSKDPIEESEEQSHRNKKGKK